MSICEEGAKIGLKTFKVDIRQRHTEADHVVEGKNAYSQVWTFHSLFSSFHFGEVDRTVKEGKKEK